MEDFFDYLLGLLLVGLVSLAGILIYFSIHAPFVANMIAMGIVVLCTGGSVIFLGKFIQKRRLAEYYPLLQALMQSSREITAALKALDRPLRKSLRFILPKVKQLRKTTRSRIWQLYLIEKTLQKLEHQYTVEMSTRSMPSEHRLLRQHAQYREHLHSIEASRDQYLDEIQDVLQCFTTLHAQLLAMRYSSDHSSQLQSRLSEPLDELLLEMETLKEIH